MKIVKGTESMESEDLLSRISEVHPNQVWLDKEKVEKRYIYLFFKRMIDIVGSIIGLILASPLMFYVAYRIRKEEPGSPIFFSHTRVGKNGKTFKMHKFRSMCLDAEEKLEELLDQNEIEGAMFKMKEDPRVTKIGKIIRAKSIDELPQLWNVLKGDMSLIGPRPPLEREVAEYTRYDLYRSSKFNVRLEVDFKNVSCYCQTEWSILVRDKNWSNLVSLFLYKRKYSKFWDDTTLKYNALNALILVYPI